MTPDPSQDLRLAADGPRHRRSVTERLLEQRTLVLSSDISSKVARRIVSSLLLLDSESSDPIRFFINSPGGEADSGMAIFDTIRFVSSPVEIIATGLIASAGTIIYCSAPKERRLAMPNLRVMMHQPSTGVRGPASDIDIEAREIIAFRERVNSLIAAATGQPLDRVKQDQQRNFWMDADGAVEYGLVGKIITNVSELA